MSGVIDGDKVDYTKAAEGTSYSRAGVIAKCPDCGQMGDRRKKGSASWLFVHHAVVKRGGSSAWEEITSSCKVKR